MIRSVATILFVALAGGAYLVGGGGPDDNVAWLVSLCSAIVAWLIWWADA